MATITSAGAIPASPSSLLSEVIAAATALSPGLTANLPGSLIEDMASTATGAVVVQDQAFVDLVNSISPYTANAPMVYALGAQYGVQQGVGSNTSVYVTFSGTPGFNIISGFVVSDGANQYTVQESGTISAGGQSPALYCLAVNPGTFPVPIATVTKIITSLPTGIVVTCTNNAFGLPGVLSQSLQSYQAQVIQAGQAIASGMPTFLKTLLANVPGVATNLVSVAPAGNNWKIICGGGDPYAVANAIYNGVFDISNLVGSTMLASSVTTAYPAVVTSNLNHGYATGQNVTLTGATGMTAINSVTYIALVSSQTTFSLNVPISSITWVSGTVTVVTAAPHGIPSGSIAGNIYGCTPTAYNGAYTFTQVNATTFTYTLATNPGAATVNGYTPLDTSTFGTYNANTATIAPNLRNVAVSINSYPDTYNILFINPPQQSVTVSLLWNTVSTNYVSAISVAALGVPAIAAYINAIYVGQPINIFDMQNAFQNAIAGLVQVNLISRMVFTVTINGVAVTPAAGTGVIYGDPESYFGISQAAISIAQG